MRKYLTSTGLIFCLVFSMLGSFGCDKAKAEKTLRDFREKSAEMSVYGGKLVTAFGDAYKAGEITRAQLGTLNTGTGAFTTALGTYRQLVAEGERIVKSGGTLPSNFLDQLDKVLDDRVIAAFFDILVKVGALPLAKSEIVKTIISGIRLTILAIKAAFGDARELGLPGQHKVFV